jgi:hypothetical protein
MPNVKSELTTKFSFLDAQVAKEPYVYEILNEISLYQEHVLNDQSGYLATFEDISNSRNIKMPFNTSRNKNIHYIIEQVKKFHPKHFQTIISFEFLIEPQTKKLILNEKIEYTILLNDEKYTMLKNDRDSKSLESLLDLLSQFRLFNLTKLMNKARNKNYLKDLVTSEINKNIFVFKNYLLDSNNLEKTEDYCFHQSNIESVKKKLLTDELKKIISTHNELIKRRLKNFGILNSDFSDYRDTKLDYIMNIILQEIPSSISKKELIIVKNYESLRKCLIEMDKIVDPIITIGGDILKYIVKNGICKQSDILSIYDGVNPDSLDNWLEENSRSHKVFSYYDTNSETLYIDGNVYLSKLSGLHQLIYHQKEKLNRMNQFEKQDYLSLFDLLCKIGKDILNHKEKITRILEKESNSEILKKIISDYEKTRQKAEEKIVEREEPVYHDFVEKKSVFASIIGFIKSIFTKKKTTEQFKKSRKTEKIKPSTSFSRETKDIFTRIRSLNQPLIALSEYVEIAPENEAAIDTIIAELRGNNLKIVIPIYNARKALYPKRSQKLLIADIEYLLVDPSIINDSDTIREFTDSLSGYKLREDYVQPAGIIAIEKYLMNLHRQNRAKIIRNKQG